MTTTCTRSTRQRVRTGLGHAAGLHL